jgi:hypothetical protein
MVQLVECLPSKYRVLSSIPTTAKKRESKKKLFPYSLEREERCIIIFKKYVSLILILP